MSSWTVSKSLAPPAGFKPNGSNSYWNGFTLVTPKANTVWDNARGWGTPPAPTSVTTPLNANNTTVAPPVTSGTAAGSNTLDSLLAKSDPFGASRQTYIDKLNGLMSNPSSIQDTPGYKFAFDQGQQALERSQAAKGMGTSGNALAELTKYGQGMASQQFDKMANLYSGLAGANQTPAQGLSSAASAYGNLATADYQRGNLALDQQRVANGQYSNDLSNQLDEYKLKQMKSAGNPSVDPYAGWVFG